MPQTILIVDDSESLRVMLGEMFSRRGFEVALAADGEDARRVASEQAVHCVLTDVEMPGMSGIDLCRTLKSEYEASGRELPVWIMTGSPQAEFTEQGLAAGAVAVLRKPFDVGQVCSQLKQSL